MGKMKRTIVLWIFLVALCSVSSVFAQRSFTLMTYNCENAFDTLHDARHDDYDFLPDGKNHWTRARYWKKLQRIAQVFALADTVKPLDMAVLQEVENDTVLTHLLRRTKLHAVEYQYVMTDNETLRGIDVAVVFSPYSFHLISHELVTAPGNNSSTDKQEHIRPVLHVWGTLSTGDTLDVFAVHLPSRLGARSAEVQRQKMGTLLRRHVDSVMLCRQSPSVVIAGDFNDSPHSPVCRKFLQAQPPVQSSYSPYTLYNLMEGRKDGSYQFHGTWEWIDQVMVNGRLLLSTNTFHTQPNCVTALRSPFLLEADETYGGLRPFRTFFGPIYHGGYSDHLPVVVSFSLP